MVIDYTFLEPGDTGRGIDPMAAMPSDYGFAPPAEPPLVYPSVPAVIPSGPQVLSLSLLHNNICIVVLFADSV